MDERAQKALDRMHSTNQKMAAELAERAIGQMAVALHQQGQPVTTQTLATALLAAVQGHKPDHLQRLQHEAAARLLGWAPAQPD